jgi:hypothetical protein
MSTGIWDMAYPGAHDWPQANDDFYDEASGTVTSRLNKLEQYKEVDNSSETVVKQQAHGSIIWTEAPSSTDSVDTIELMKHIELIFFRAASEEFETGMDSNFSQDLGDVIYEFKNIALATIAYIIRDGKSDISVISEALRTLGDLEEPITHRNRLKLLELALTSDSSYVRDAASLGIASMDNPEAISKIKQAIEIEKNRELKKDLLLVLTQLEETKQCLLLLE